MPQARLPDINTAYITYRREAINSWKGKNYDSCFGSIQSLNGLLPEKYRVTMSTIEYNKLHDQPDLIACPRCKEESEYNMAMVYELVLPLVDNILSSNGGRAKVWNCPKCKMTNELNSEQVITQTLKEPYFLQVVPKPPLRRDGMMDRRQYHIHFSTWFWTTMSELEAQMAQFRDDNWHKGDELIEGFDETIDGGEEQDT